MRWAKVSVLTTHEGAELIGNILMELGAAGVEIDDPALVNKYIDAGLWDYTDLPRAKDTDTVTVHAYLPEDEALQERLTSLASYIEALRTSIRLGAGTVSHTFVADEDWAETWKAYVHTERIGQRITVRPTWEDYTPSGDEIIIDLDPGAAFGTGSHARTAMCIRWLERLVRPGMHVFDVGCGSGILSIAAAKLGAHTVRAMDYDTVAVRVAKENVMQNGAQTCVHVCESDLLAACAHGETAQAQSRRSSSRRTSSRILLYGCFHKLSSILHQAERFLHPVSSTIALSMWNVLLQNMDLRYAHAPVKKNGRRWSCAVL